MKKVKPQSPQAIRDVARNKKMFLISEFCAASIYMGWHLYLRDSKARQQRNVGGGWGWLRSSFHQDDAHALLRSMGMTLRGDNSCDDGAYAELARRFPIPRQRIGGKPRGCVEVELNENGWIVLPAKTPKVTSTTKQQIHTAALEEAAEVCERQEKLYLHNARGTAAGASDSYSASIASKRCAKMIRCLSDELDAAPTRRGRGK